MATLKDIDLLKVGHTIQLAGGVYVGENKVYLVMFPDEHCHLEVLPTIVFQDKDVLSVVTLNLSKDEWATFLRQTDLLETEVLAKAEDGGVVKAIMRKSTRQIEQGVSWVVFKRDGYQCRYCGNDDVPLTVDHLILWEQQGPSVEENLVSSCRKCNKMRGNTPYEEWLKHPYYLKVSRNLFADVRQANDDLVSTLGAIQRRPHQRSR